VANETGQNERPVTVTALPFASQAAPMAVVAIAASAGGLTALSQILEALPAKLPAAVLAMLHLQAARASLLPEILARRTALEVVAAQDGQPVRVGTVYIAPPDHHLRITPALGLRLTETPAVHFVRPSADVLFRSLADACGPRGIGVICTGSGRDGAAGLAAIRACGGTTIAQDEATSEHFGMPGEAIRCGAAQRILPLSEIAPTLIELVARLESGATPE
jgi:two-component system chemotaxis response regulator CheB